MLEVYAGVSSALLHRSAVAGRSVLYSVVSLSAGVPCVSGLCYDRWFGKIYPVSCLRLYC